MQNHLCFSYYILKYLGRISEISATIKNLNGSRVMIPIILPFNLPIWHIQKAEVSWRMTMDYHKSNYMVTSIAATVSDLAFLMD